LRAGFTLVELLVVVGIIAVLIALLVPVLGKARASSQSVSCLSNLRQVMMAFHLYAGDSEGLLPDPTVTLQSWESHLKPYLSGKEAFHCPSDGGLFDKIRSSYDWRDTGDPLTTVAGKSLSTVRRPNLIFAFDALPDWHGKQTINAALGDGSAQRMDYVECLRDLDRPINEN
jgi:prepilin-type N-terminal cleavage/methylation domain-containing protein